MSEPDPRVRELLETARERPGTVVTVYSEADRQELRRIAARRRRDADRLDREAGGGPS